MRNSEIRVFLVDDHEVLLDGLRLLLRNVPDIVVVRVAPNGQYLLEKLATNPRQADVILMDIEMPKMDGIQATAQVKKLYPHLKVIMLTMKEDFSAVDDAVAQGADGFISKNNGQKAIITAIRQVCNNGEFIIQANLNKPQISSRSTFSRTQQNTKDIRLTEREKQILILINQNKHIAQIAQKLSLSIPSLITHLKVLFSKLGVSSGEDAVRVAIEKKLIPPPNNAST